MALVEHYSRRPSQRYQQRVKGKCWRAGSSSLISMSHPKGGSSKGSGKIVSRPSVSTVGRATTLRGDGAGAVQRQVGIAAVEPPPSVGGGVAAPPGELGSVVSLFGWRWTVVYAGPAMFSAGEYRGLRPLPILVVQDSERSPSNVNESAPPSLPAVQVREIERRLSSEVVTSRTSMDVVLAPAGRVGDVRYFIAPEATAVAGGDEPVWLPSLLVRVERLERELAECVAWTAFRAELQVAGSVVAPTAAASRLAIGIAPASRPRGTSGGGSVVVGSSASLLQRSRSTGTAVAGKEATAADHGGSAREDGDAIVGWETTPREGTRGRGGSSWAADDDASPPPIAAFSSTSIQQQQGVWLQRSEPNPPVQSRHDSDAPRQSSPLLVSSANVDARRGCDMATQTLAVDPPPCCDRCRCSPPHAGGAERSATEKAHVVMPPEAATGDCRRQLAELRAFAAEEASTSGVPSFCAASSANTWLERLASLAAAIGRLVEAPQLGVAVAGFNDTLRPALDFLQRETVANVQRALQTFPSEMPALPIAARSRLELGSAAAPAIVSDDDIILPLEDSTAATGAPDGNDVNGRPPPSWVPVAAMLLGRAPSPERGEDAAIAGPDQGADEVGAALRRSRCYNDLARLSRRLYESLFAARLNAVAVDEQLSGRRAVFAAVVPAAQEFASRSANETLLLAELERLEAVSESVRRLLYDASEAATHAGRLEADGDVDGAEACGIRKVALLQRAQDAIDASCDSAFRPSVTHSGEAAVGGDPVVDLRATLINGPLAALKRVEADTRQSLGDVEQSWRAKHAAAHLRLVAAADALDQLTSGVVRDAYAASREAQMELDELKRVQTLALDAATRAVEALESLRRAADLLRQLQARVAGTVDRRAAVLAEYEEERARVVSKCWKEQAAGDWAAAIVRTCAWIGQAWLPGTTERETAALMCFQRRMWETSFQLHEQHFEVHRRVVLAAGEIRCRKRLLHRRVVEDVKTTEALLAIAGESAAETSQKSRQIADQRKQLLAVSEAIDAEVATLDRVIDESAQAYIEHSEKPLLIAGHPPRSGEVLLELQAADEKREETFLLGAAATPSPLFLLSSPVTTAVAA